MRKINYPLIISDFDGTLLKSDGTINDRTIKAIDEYTKEGGIFAICTGRMKPSILPQARKLKIKGLVVSFQGYVISDIETDKILLDGYFSSKEAIKICKILEEMNLHIHVYTMDDFYSNVQDKALEFYENICKVKAEIISNMPLSKFLEDKDLKIRKVLVMVEKKERVELYEKIKSILGDKYDITCSSSCLIEITSGEYSKGTAVKFLADYYNIPIEKTVACGDNLNDLSMIRAAGVGIAVKNGEEEIKKYSVPFEFSNDEDAIAEVIERYGFTKE